MVNPELERRFADCSELVEAWRFFLDLVNRAVKSPQAINPEMEQDFLSTKARIAMLFDSFVDAVKHDRNVASNMLGIVNRAITLKSVAKASPAEAKKLEIEWHEVYLLLNEAVSHMDETRSELKDKSELMWKLGRSRDRLLVQVRGFFRSVYFKIIVGLAALWFVVWGVPAFGIYDWDNLRDQGWAKKTVAMAFQIQRNVFGWNAPYISLEQFMNTLLDGQTPGLSHEVLPQLATKATAIRSIQHENRSFEPNAEGRTLTDMLNSANEYTLIKFGGDGGKVAYAFIFWYRSTADAFAVDRAYTDNIKSVAENYTFLRRQNVIAVVKADPIQGTQTMAQSQAFVQDVSVKRFIPMK